MIAGSGAPDDDAMNAGHIVAERQLQGGHGEKLATLGVAVRWTVGVLREDDTIMTGTRVDRVECSTMIETPGPASLTGGPGLRGQRASAMDAEPGAEIADAWYEEIRKRCRKADEGAVELREASEVFARAYRAIG